MKPSARNTARWIHERHANDGDTQDETSPRSRRHSHAFFCFEDPDSAVGESVATLAKAIAKLETPVHIFSRKAFDLSAPGIYIHQLGGASEDSLFSQVQEFMRRASNAFLREFHAGSQVTLMGFEWTAIPAVSLLRAIRNESYVLSLHSLERQRNNLMEGISQYIEETELAGLREAKLILCHNDGTAETARRCVPECTGRIETMNPMTLIRDFQFDLDRGEVKGRYDVGPTDPTILFVGDLNESYGPDLLMKAVPEILRNHGQARFIFVGDGELLWPLRINSRYMLLDYAVRLVGHLDGQALRELVYASDVIVVPSRTATPWWPLEAAWAANRPVLTTPEAAAALAIPDRNAAVVNADEASIAAGVDRILRNPEFAQAIASEGRATLKERYNVKKVVARFVEVMETAVTQERRPESATV
ncbi:MAG: glycosyltransferase family 4 protein [Pirellulales bacterium]|nr:glycosyltransferase family 4 protein [Pirellulales bacterium]